MKEKMQNKYFAWGITIFSVFAALIILFFAFYRWHYIASFIKTIFTILMPFIYGLAIAYLMNPIVNFFEKKVFNILLRKIIKSRKRLVTISRILSLLTSTIIFVGLIVTVISFLIPEIIKSLQVLFGNMNTYLNDTKEFFINIFGGSEDIRRFINDNFKNFSEYINTFINSRRFDDVVTVLGNSLFGIIKALYNLVIGYIISIYVLYDKERFKAQIKKVLYTFFDNEKVNIIIENTIYTDKVFGGFFSGKLIDSLIIGILCFICMLLLKMPYSLIIAVIVGVTNFIPYFGPFIGAIPSAFLILLVNPGKCVIFLIFIFILQQIDGNVIGPKILGGKTGLSSFWVLFSLLIFGGLFGMVGMILGVPIFSIFYSFINGLIKKRLEAKNLPVNSKDYEKLISIDEKTGKPIYAK